MFYIIFDTKSKAKSSENKAVSCDPVAGVVVSGVVNGEVPLPGLVDVSVVDDSVVDVSFSLQLLKQSSKNSKKSSKRGEKFRFTHEFPSVLNS